MATLKDFRAWNDDDTEPVLVALHGVVDLHEKRHYYNFEGATITYCDHCTGLNDGYDVLWPCETMQVVEKAGVVTES